MFRFQLGRAVWMLLLRLPALLTGFLLLLATPGYSQDPATMLAVTVCRGQSVATYINVEMLGTDSAKEIQVHEAVHRAQAHAAIARLGHCPSYQTDPLLLLHDEVEAYCVSSNERAKRGKDEEEINYSTINRLRNEFQNLLVISDDSLIATWKQGCPKWSNPQPRRQLSGRDELVTSTGFCATSDCDLWRPYRRIGDTPVAGVWIAFNNAGEACIIDGMTAAKIDPAGRAFQRLICDWRRPSGMN